MGQQDHTVVVQSDIRQYLSVFMIDLIIFLCSHVDYTAKSEPMMNSTVSLWFCTVSDSRPPQWASIYRLIKYTENHLQILINLLTTRCH